jgi:hypothetical protein
VVEEESLIHLVLIAVFAAAAVRKEEERERAAVRELK